MSINRSGARRRSAGPPARRGSTSRSAPPDRFGISGTPAAPLPAQRRPVPSSVSPGRSTPDVIVLAEAPTQSTQVGLILFWSYPVVVAVLAVVSLVAAGTLPGEIVKNLMGVACVAAAGAGIRLYRPRDTSGWHLLMLGETCWVLGGLVTSYVTLTGKPLPIPMGDGGVLDPYQMLCLVGYLPLAGALFQFERSRWGNRLTAGHIDSGIVTLGLGLLTLVLAIDPVLVEGSSAGSKFFLIATPVADLIIVASLTRLVTSTGTQGTSVRLLVSGGCMLLFSDVIWESATLRGGNPPTLAAIAWLTAVVLVSAAPLHPSMRAITDAVAADDSRLTTTRILFLTFALLCPPIALVIQILTPGEHSVWPIVGVAVAEGVLVLTRIAGILRGIQSQAMLLSDLARTDHLTGLPNRRSADAVLEGLLLTATEWNRSNNGAFPPVARDIAVTMIDLDHFKRLNDQFGHQVGDRLLAQAAEVWRHRLRRGDVLARYGGEEFVLISSGSTAPELVKVLEDLRNETPMRQSFSAGLAIWDGQESGPTLLSRADAALYQAKEAGRGRTVVADGGLGSPPARPGAGVADQAGDQPGGDAMDPHDDPSVVTDDDAASVELMTAHEQGWPDSSRFDEDGDGTGRHRRQRRYRRP